MIQLKNFELRIDIDRQLITSKMNTEKITLEDPKKPKIDIKFDLGLIYQLIHG